MPASATPSPDRLSDFNRDRRILLLVLMAAVLGLASAGVAAALLELIALATNLAFHQRFSFALSSPTSHAMGWTVVLVPAIGGLLIGLMARFGSERIRGHGIPEALEAILIGRSRMDPKVAILKPLSSAISIGTGGPFGAEGPIIMTGGAVGSLFAQLFHLSASERKTLLVAGAAGGMAAVFATPVAAVLLAVELLLFEWRPRSFIPVAVSALVAGLARVPLLGAGPVFPVTAHGVLSASTILMAAGVGLVAGLGAMALTGLVYGFEDLFPKFRVHWMWWPALGGLAVGIGGLIDPRALGVGYELIHGLLRGENLGGALMLLLVVKALIWSIALGSGTSGGVLAPLLIIGGTLGALGSHWLPGHDAALWALIGMAALMGGTMRSPLTAVVFALELTRDFSAMTALLAACVAAHLLTVLFMRRSILTEKMARRGHHLMREYSVDPFLLTRVGDIMEAPATAVPAAWTVRELSDRFSDPDLQRHQAFPLADAHGKVAGIVTRGDVLRALEEDPDGKETLLSVGNADPVTACPDELVDEALARMLRQDVGRLLVVRREDARDMVGYLGRATILAARMRRMEEEHKREPGWLQSRFGRSRA